MKILFLDTTQDWIHISLSILTQSEKPIIQVIYEKLELCPKESSYRLVSEIQKAFDSLHWSIPDAIICLTGPGSFTGIRISVSTSRNLAQLWNVPVLGIDSLEAISLHFAYESTLPVFIALDGKQNKHYFGRRLARIYNGSSDLDENGILKEIEKFTSMEHCFVYSGKKPNCFPNCSIKIEETLPRSMHILNENIEKILKLTIKESNFNHLTPNYIRGSYVETNKK